MSRVLAAILFVLTLTASGPANADGPCSGAASGGGSYTVGITCTRDDTVSTATSGEVGSSTQDTGPVYAYEALCERRDGLSAAPYGCVGELMCGSDGSMQAVYAYYPDGSSEYINSVCVEPGEQSQQAVLTPGRILEAFRRIPVPSPSIGVNPVGGRTLVNFDTILHTEAEPFTETVQLLGRRVTFEIEPSEFSWRTGQGDGFTTGDPGQAYQASLPMSAYVTHRYLRAGDVELGLDTTWTARWRVGDGPWRPVDGTVTTSSDPVPLEIVTARPQLVSYD